MTHTHAFTIPPSPAQHEDADFRRSCECGAREPEHEHVWQVTRIDGSTIYLGRCRDCDLTWSAAQQS